MSWIQIFYVIGVIVGFVVSFLLLKELGKIFTQKEDYDDKVDLPD